MLLLKTVDEISLDLNADVLYVTILVDGYKSKIGKRFSEEEIFEHNNRNKFMHWLVMKGIGFEECIFRNLHDISKPYQGELYLDVPYDESNHRFKKVAQYLETVSSADEIRLHLFKREWADEYNNFDNP